MKIISGKFSTRIGACVLAVLIMAGSFVPLKCIAADDNSSSSASLSSIQIASENEAQQEFSNGVQYGSQYYRLGRYDVINVLVFGLNDGMINSLADSNTYSGTGNTAGSGNAQSSNTAIVNNGNALKNLLIGPDGCVTLPYVCSVKVKGLTLSEAKEVIASSLKKYVKIPSMEVVVARYGTKKIAVVGAVIKPGYYDMQEDSMYAYSAVSTAGGMKYNAANSHIRVIRMDNGKAYLKEIDLDAYVNKLDGNQNVRLQDGDMIFVPTSGWKWSLTEDVMPLMTAWAAAFSIYTLAKQG